MPRTDQLSGESSRAGISRFNPFDTDFNDDPYPIYARLRRESPIFSLPGCLGRDWIVTRHEDVKRILGDERFVVDDLPSRIRSAGALRGRRLDLLARTLEDWLFFMDGAEHARVRRAMVHALSHATSEVAGFGVLCAETERLLRRALDSGRLDIVADIARPLPALAMARMIGVAPSDAAALASVASDLFGIFTQPLPPTRYERIEERLDQLLCMLQPIVRNARHGGSDVISRLIAATDQRDVPERMLLSICSMLFAVGQDTTQNLIGNAVSALIEHPQAVRQLHDEPERLRGAVRELARFDSPVQLVLRVAAMNVHYRGMQIAPGERVHLFIGAANRDPAVFPDPDVIRFDRDRLDSLPFGYGTHSCVGQQLAFAETEAALRCLLPILPRLRRMQPAQDRLRASHMRGLRSLQLTLDGQVGA